MDAYKVTLSEPYSVAGPDGYLLDVGHKAFKGKAGPYLVPASQFWMNRKIWGVFSKLEIIENAEYDKNGKLVEVKKEAKNDAKK